MQSDADTHDKAAIERLRVARETAEREARELRERPEHTEQKAGFIK